MPIPAYLTQPSISIAYLQLLVEILGERGISGDQLLDGLRMNPALLENSQARMSATQWTRLVMRAQALTRDPGLGYAYGLRMRPTVHGVLGYAAMSCASLRQALEICCRYARVRQAGFIFEFREDRDFGYLILREQQPIPVMRTFFVENLLLGMTRAGAVLAGSPMTRLKDVEIHFDIQEPPYYQAWRDRLPPVRFDQTANRIAVPARYLDIRPVLADPMASQQAIALCEQELVLAAHHESDLVGKLRAELKLRPGFGYATLEQVAETLCMSPRTLKRKLQQQGTSFLLMLEETRCEDARQLLQHSDLPIADIGTRLGYENPANFSRAFLRWTGESPSTFRNRQRHTGAIP